VCAAELEGSHTDGNTGSFQVNPLVIMPDYSLSSP
jgi:hypothetical protein